MLRGREEKIDYWLGKCSIYARNKATALLRMAVVNLQEQIVKNGEIFKEEPTSTQDVIELDE